MDDVTFESDTLVFDAQAVTPGTVYVISFAPAVFDEPEVTTGGESFF